MTTPPSEFEPRTAPGHGVRALPAAVFPVRPFPFVTPRPARRRRLPVLWVVEPARSILLRVDPGPGPSGRAST